MKPVTAPGAAVRTPLRGPADATWNERAGRLFEEFERPAKAMVRRAFRGAFGPHELDDIYAGAWVGTLRALADRHAELADDEVRSYVLTAVANQASKELRRRRRKPTAPIEAVGPVPDRSGTPEERAESSERSLVARDVLASLPPRRRAVMLLRYGWGLDPAQICRLISGLSPRAYRKEITRGVDQVATRMRAAETGEWCDERENLLKRFVAGVTEEDETRQARAHLSHCRRCSAFVARLSGHLHDLGGGVAAVGAIDGIDGRLALGDRLLELGDRAAGVVARNGVGSGEPGGTLVGAGGVRGAGAAGAGVLAKFAGLGAAGKALVACVGGGVAVSACIAAGVTPFGTGSSERPSADRAPVVKKRDERPRAKPLEVEVLPTQVGNEAPPPAQPTTAGEGAPEVATEAAPNSPEARAPAEPTVAPTAPPEQQEFSVEAAAVAPPAQAPATPAPAPSSGGGGLEQSEASAANTEFGP